jgi:hypothetical protein
MNFQDGRRDSGRQAPKQVVPGAECIHDHFFSHGSGMSPSATPYASRYAIGGMRGAQDHQARLMRYQWFGSCMLESLPWRVHFLLTRNRQFGFDVTAFMPKMFTHQIVA